MFQDRQSYTEKPCPKKKINKKELNNNNNKMLDTFSEACLSSCPVPMFALFFLQWGLIMLPRLASKSLALNGTSLLIPFRRDRKSAVNTWLLSAWTHGSYTCTCPRQLKSVCGEEGGVLVGEGEALCFKGETSSRLQALGWPRTCVHSSALIGLIRLPF